MSELVSEGQLFWQVIWPLSARDQGLGIVELKRRLEIVNLKFTISNLQCCFFPLTPDPNGHGTPCPLRLEGNGTACKGSAPFQICAGPDVTVGEEFYKGRLF